MGYESKLYIVEKHPRILDKAWGKTLAIFNLGNCYPLSDILRNKPATDCFVYADDGNTQILEDKYGKPLTETSIEDVISIVESIVMADNLGVYRTLRPLLAALKSYKNCEESWGNLRVLHFGY